MLSIHFYLFFVVVCVVVVVVFIGSQFPGFDIIADNSRHINEKTESVDNV